MNIAAIFGLIGKVKEAKGQYREIRRGRKAEKIKKSLDYKMNVDGLSRKEAITWVSVKYKIPEDVLLRDYFESEDEPE